MKMRLFKKRMHLLNLKAFFNKKYEEENDKNKNFNSA